MPWSLRMLIYITLVAIALQFYVALKVSSAIAILARWTRKRARMTTAAIWVWIVLYPVAVIGSHWLNIDGVSRRFQQSNLLLDALITYPYWVGVIMAFQAAMLFILSDTARLALFPLYRKHKQAWLRWNAWIVIATVSAGTIYTAIRIYTDTFTVSARETELRIAGLPAELDGFRIVQIADLQADGRTNGNKLDRFIDEVNRLNADLILFGGDLVTSGTDHIETGAAAFNRMKARRGIYACLGDHDYFSDSRLVRSSLEKNGVTVLNNTATVVPVDSSFISLTGLTNVYRTRPSDVALRTIEEQRPRGPVNILLTHQPSREIVRYAVGNRYDLVTAGHTHGGQIVLPFPFFLLTPSSFETDYVSGFYRVGETTVSVTNGLGLTLAPVRYRAGAEVTLIVLRKSD
ncbi:MAG: metallophosphoesterase [Acidobacteriota bacterium]